MNEYLYDMALRLSLLLLVSLGALSHSGVGGVATISRNASTHEVGGDATVAPNAPTHIARDRCISLQRRSELKGRELEADVEQFMLHYRSAWGEWEKRASSGRGWTALREASALGCEYRDIGNKSLDNLVKPITAEGFSEYDVNRYVRAVYGYGMRMRSEAALYIYSKLESYYYPKDVWTQRLIQDLLKLLFVQFCLNPSDPTFGHLANADIQRELLNLHNIELLARFVFCKEAYFRFPIQFNASFSQQCPDTNGFLKIWIQPLRTCTTTTDTITSDTIGATITRNRKTSSSTTSTNRNNRTGATANREYWLIILIFVAGSLVLVFCVLLLVAAIIAIYLKKMESRNRVAQLEDMQHSVVRTIQRTVSRSGQSASSGNAIADDVTVAPEPLELQAGFRRDVPQTRSSLLMPFDRSARARCSSSSSVSTIALRRQRQQTVSSYPASEFAWVGNKQPRATTASPDVSDSDRDREQQQMQRPARVFSRAEGAVSTGNSGRLCANAATATTSRPDTSTTSTRNTTGDERQQELCSLIEQPTHLSSPNADADTYTQFDLPAPPPSSTSPPLSGP